MKLKSNLLFLFFLLAGVIFGTLLASSTAGIPALGWLSYGASMGISAQNPLVLDLVVAKLALGLEMSVNVAQILTIFLALMAYRAFGKKL